MFTARAATRLLPAAVAAVALSAGLAACGHTVSVGRGRTLRVALTEYRVIPQSIRSSSGQLTLVVRNDGRLTHDLTISRGSTVIDQTLPLAPGESTYLVLDLQRGSYVMASSLFADQALGQYGTLSVG
jgi:hypothetical protein